MKRTSISLIACALCMGLMTSCISNKKMIYLQGATQAYAVPQEIEEHFELQVQPDDQLAISVASKDNELIKSFNNNTLIGGGNNSQTGTNTINVSSGVSYFQVDKDGNIEFPIFGTLHVGGMTTRQISQMLQSRMINEGYINDAVVNTRIMSFKVTILGDVRNPGTQTYQGERLTILEALGKAGDLNNSAYRDNVLVVREENGELWTYRLDFTMLSNLVNSPVYYLQQNDVIYVSPNKVRAVSSANAGLWLSMVSTVASAATVIVTVINATK